MKALFLALQTFWDMVTNQRVTAMCDNSTVVAYVCRGGWGSLRLPLRVDRTTSPLDGIPQRAPGSKIPSGTIERPRGSSQPPQPSTSGGMVPAPTGSEEDHPHLGIPDNRPIRNTLNTKLPLYCSLIPDPQAVFEDALRHPWNHLDVYAFPPFNLVDRLVARVRETPNLSMTDRPPLAGEVLVRRPPPPPADPTPLTLPLWDCLLRQPHFHRFHGGVHALNLHAWRPSNVSSESQAFRDELRASCPYVSESPLPACTNRNGSPSVVGVVEGALPIDATIPVIVDFLIHLREDKGFSLSALKGYCSTINSVFILKGLDLANSKELSMF